MNKVGIHLHGPARDIERLLDVGFGCYTVLDCDADAWLPAILESAKGGLVLLRTYHRDVLSLSPADWAAHGAAQLERWGQRVRHITPANELNLAVEGGGGSVADFRRADAWLRQWAAAMRRLCPWATLHWPALSPLDAASESAAMALLAASVAAYDVVDAHCYWRPDGGLRDASAADYAMRFERVHQLAPDKPLFISEFNRAFDRGDAAIADEYRYFYHQVLRRRYVLGATSFVWSSPDPAFAAYEWVGECTGGFQTRPDLIAAIATMPKASLEGETTVDGTDRFRIRPDIYAAMAATAARYGLELPLLAAVCYQESGFDPDAVGDDGHSVGLMQLHDAGAGAGMSVAERRDPARNLDVGARYLAAMIAATGSVADGLSAYNQGLAGWRQRGRAANQPYVDSVLAHYERFQQHGIAPAVEDAPTVAEVEAIDGVPVAFAFLKEYRRRGRSDGRPRGPAAYCGDDCVQGFESGAVYVWAGGRVHVLNDAV